MQNLPFLVAQASPVKSLPSSGSHQAKQETSQSFKQTLSKQVARDEMKAPLGKSGNPKAKDDDKQNRTDVATGKTTGAVADAQSLASTTIAKSLQDATDGEVNIVTLQEEVLLPVENVAPAIQTIAQQTVTNKGTTIGTDALQRWKQSMTDITTEAAVNEVAVEEADVDKIATKTTSQLPVNPLKDANETINPKLANVLATENKPLEMRKYNEMPVETSIKSAPDISTVPLQALAKPASVLATSPLQAGASNTINAFPGKTGWNEAVSQKVVWMIGATEQSATLTLNPKDLGPLQVIIHVNNEKADATFISENPEVRKALEEGMSSLRNLMGQAGIELGQANVNTNKQQQEFQQASKEYAAKQANGDSMSQDADHAGNVQSNMRVSHGLVDTFV
ncbi:MAG: flagellar hook-length control protein FliK [Methylophilaceae bacterium]